MKVLYLLHRTTFDGSTISFMNMLNQLIKKGVEPYLIIPANHISPEFIIYLNEHAIRYKVTKYISFEINLNYSTNFDKIKWIKKIIRHYIHKFKYKQLISKIIIDFDPDIIHTNVGIIHEGFNIAKKYRIPHIWHLREYQDLDFGHTFYPSKNGFIKKLKQSHVITISKDISNHFLLSEYPKVITIYNGIEYKINTKLIIPKNKYFLCASRISQEKGFEDVITAFGKFYKTNPEYKLLIAGKGETEYVEKLKALAGEYGCLNSIDFLGFRTDISDLMSHATALLVGSIYEGFGRMTAEACFAGCLVIGRNTGGTKEILDRTGGYLFNNIEEMLQQMLLVSSLSENEYHNIVKEIQQKATESYSIESNGDLVYNLYSKMIETQYN